MPTPTPKLALLSLVRHAEAPFDPVVTLLGDLLKTSQEHITPATVAGLLGLMDRFDFNPNARVQNPDSDTSISALEAVLQLAHRSPQDPSQFAWPQDMADLVLPLPDRPATLVSLDAQWLAATLLAAGADPWESVSSEHPLGTVLPLAMRMHMAGLCERMWMCLPRRPSIDTLTVQRPPEVKKATRSWLDWATEEVDGAGLVRWLLSIGVRSPPGNHSLGWASVPAMVNVYHEMGYLPVSPKEQKQVVLAWEGRLTKGTLETSTLSALKQALSDATNPAACAGQETSANSEAHDRILQTLASSAWQGDSSYTSGRFTIEELNSRTVVESGLHKGQWSLFAAILINPIRPPYTHTIGRQDFGRLMNVPGGEDCHYGSRPPIDWAAYRGQLTQAIDFDWRPDISINGPVGIALHAYDPRYHEFEREGEREELCGLLGIDDFTAWWRANAISAAGFTKALGAASPNAFARLHHIWFMLQSKDPDTFKNNPRAALLMLQYFNRHFFLDGAGNGSGVGRVDQVADTHHVNGTPLSVCSYHLVGWMLDNAPPVLDVDWQVEIALLGNVDAPEQLENLVELANRGRLEKSHIARIKDYIDITLKRVPSMLKKDDTNNFGHTHTYVKARGDLFEKRVLPKLRQVMLSAKLPQTSGSSARARL